MKRLFILSVTVILATLVSAQEPVGTWSLKPMVGTTLSSYIGNDYEWPSMKWGLTGGVELGYQVSNTFGLSIGVLYGQQGCKVDEKEYQMSASTGFQALFEKDTRITTEHVFVPVMGEFYVTKGLALKAGLQMEFLTKAKMKRYLVDRPMEPAEHRIVSKNLKDDLHNLVLSLPVGISFEYKGLVVDARYHLGLTNVLRENESTIFYPDNKHLKNSVLQLTLGYKFAL